MKWLFAVALEMWLLVSDWLATPALEHHLHHGLIFATLVHLHDKKLAQNFLKTA